MTSNDILLLGLSKTTIGKHLIKGKYKNKMKDKNGSSLNLSIGRNAAF